MLRPAYRRTTCRWISHCRWRRGRCRFRAIRRSSRRSSGRTNGHLSHEFTATTHSGTHVDAPAHYVEGSTTVDRLDLGTLVGPATVLDLRSYRGEPIPRAVLDEESPTLDPGARLVLVTGDVDALPVDESFFEEASVLTEDAADWLVERGVSLVANDFLTEGLSDPDRPVHHTVLGADVPFVEYLCHTSAGSERLFEIPECHPGTDVVSNSYREWALAQTRV